MYVILARPALDESFHGNDDAGTDAGWQRHSIRGWLQANGSIARQLMKMQAQEQV